MTLMTKHKNPSNKMNQPDANRPIRANPPKGKQASKRREQIAKGESEAVGLKVTEETKPVESKAMLPSTLFEGDLLQSVAVEPALAQMLSRTGEQTKGSSFAGFKNHFYINSFS